MKLMVIDGNSMINRSFYGIRPLSTRDGLYTHAVFGFLTTLTRLREEEKPDAVCVTFDVHAPTFRHTADESYKATRKPMPEELRMQMPVLKEVLDALNIPRYELEGWEADDLIGTISRRCEADGWECVVVTGDKDSLQLITDHTKVKLVSTRMGQTTTKDMIAAVLSTRYRVLKTEGNYNNNIGLPLTLLRLDRSCEICVLEMGMDRPGEIDYLGEIVQPDVGVITNIGDAHIERLGSRENIFRAKCELLPHIRPGGLVVLNGDDPMLASLRGRTPVPAVFCGREEGLEYRARRLEGDGDSRILCQMTTPRMDRQVEIPALGEHMIYPALIAAAIGERFGLTQDQIVEGILRFVPTRMRMNILYRGDGIVILDDTYNANPQSMRAAISVLSDRRSQWSIAVLGDMFELGPFAPALHTGVGECLGKARIDCLVAVGELAEHIAQGARNSGVPLVYHCKDKAEAKPVLDQLVRPGSTILVKASRGMELEELTAYLLSITPEAE